MEHFRKVNTGAKFNRQIPQKKFKFVVINVFVDRKQETDRDSDCCLAER